MGILGDERAEESVYFSGDSGYDTHYQEIGEALGPFDLVFMDYGQYDEGWRAVHNLPEEGIRGFVELKGEHLVPVGWGCLIWLFITGMIRRSRPLCLLAHEE